MRNPYQRPIYFTKVKHMEKSYFKCFRLFLDTWKKITDVNLKAQYYESLLEYWLNGVKPTDPIVDALLTSAMYSIDKSDEERERKSESMKGNSNAVKTWENISKQSKTDTDREQQTKTYEEKKKKEEYRRIEDKKNKEDIKKEKINKKKFLDFVELSEDEHSKLIQQLWQRLTDELIDKLNNYIWSTWKKYRSHYFTILNRSKKEQPHTQTNYEFERQAELHRQKIREQIESFKSENKQNAETWLQDGWYNRRQNIRLSDIPW